MSFPRYAEYKDSGIEWLGEVPGHWDTQRGRFLFEIKKRIAGEEGYDVLSITQQGIRVKDTDSNDGQLSNDYSKYQFVFPGDFAMNHMDLLTGWVDISRKTGVTSPDYRVFSLRDEQSHSGKYFLYLFQNAYRQKIFYAFGQGSSQLGRWRLPTEQFNDFWFPRPPLPEQTAIAAFLDRETAKIDALVAEQERLITLLAEKRQAVISHAVTKGLDPASLMKDSGIEWFGEVPEHWEVVRLKFLAYVQSGVAKGRELVEADTIEVPYLRVANVQDGYLDLDDIATIQIAAHELDRYRLVPGDVLMNEGGDFDKLGRGHIWRGEIAPCIHQNHVFAVRPDGIEPEWLNLLTSADCGRFYFMSRSKQSTNLASISSTNICEFPLICPPAAERRAIVEHVTTETARLDALTAEARRAIDLLKEHRSALISAAVTGKIDVRPRSAEIIPFTPRQKRNLVAAEAVRRCHGERTFGRIKAQKLFYMLETHLDLNEFEGRYLRYRKGPFDGQMMASIAHDLEVAGWFREIEDDGRYFYRSLDKAKEVSTLFAEAFDGRVDEIVRLIELLRPLDSDTAEVIATLYAAWNDFLLRGEAVDDAKLLTEVTTNWHESKKSIPQRAWKDGLRWMRQHGVVPRGTGSQTIQQMSLGL